MRATMKNINHWREKRREAEHALAAAYHNDLPEGTRVGYFVGKHEVTVRIVEHIRAGWYVKVANPVTGREYLLPYERIHRVIQVST